MSGYLRNIFSLIFISLVVFSNQVFANEKNNHFNPYEVLPNNKIRIINTISDGTVSNVDTVKKELIIVHDNGMVSIFKNMEEIAPTLYLEKYKRIRRGYILGYGNEKTIFEFFE